jgi:Outer membrane protein beta-barrel domain
MNRLFSLLFLFAFLPATSFSQANISADKEFRISTGLGFANATENIKSVGPDFWIQFEYKVSKPFSIAMEFENMNYKQPGYYDDLPVNPNEIKVHDNNFSLLVKYHFPTPKKLKIALASGWTYCVRQNEYFIYEKDSTSSSWFPNVTSSSDYRVPFLAEVAYPLSTKINITTRLKYNTGSQNGDTFSGGIGLSLKL